MSWSYMGFGGFVCVSFLLCLSASLSFCLSDYSDPGAHMRANLYAGSVSRPEKNELIEVWLYS